MPIIVEGLEVIRPQAVSVVDERIIAGLQEEQPTVVALAARADGGTTSQWLEFRDVSDIRRRYRGGDLVNLAERILAPSQSNPGATKVLLYRMNNASSPALRATLNLNSAGAVAAIVLTARDYGVHTNQIRVKTTYDATNDAYTVSIGGFDALGTITRTKIQRAMLGIKYLGANATATVAISATTLTITAGTGEGGSFVLSEYSSIQSLVDAIRGLGAGLYDVVVKAANPKIDPTQLDVYSAISIAPPATTVNDAAGITTSATTITVTSTAGFPSSGVIKIDSEEITYTGTTATTFTGCGRGANGTTAATHANSAVVKQTTASMLYKEFKANNQALTDWFNYEQSYVSAVKLTGIRLLDMTGYANLMGGGNGSAPTNADWQAALDALQSQDVQLVCVGSESETVHAIVDAHCQLMSGQGYNRERNAIVGGAAGQSSAQAIARATTLGSYRTSLAWPGYVERDPVTRLEVIRSPMFSAATIAGLVAGLAVGRPATRKSFRCVRPEVTLNPATLDSVLMNGVMAIEPEAIEGARVAQAITTYQIGTDPEINLLRRELSSRMATDALVRMVRDSVAEMAIGSAIDSLFLNRAYAVADSALRRAQALGLIVGSPGRGAYGSLSVRAQADALVVRFGAYVVSPANYVVVEAVLNSFQGGVR